MAEKILEFIGSDGLPDAMHVRIDMDMPYDLALKILDLIEREMPKDFGDTEDKIS
jgi:hypothetical protein